MPRVKDSKVLCSYAIAAVVLAAFLITISPYSPAAFGYTISIGPCQEYVNSQTFLQLVAHLLNINALQPQQYQFEGNPCHLLYVNGSIGMSNYTPNGGVDAPIVLYKNTLLIPISQPMSTSTYMPSYFPPSNWSKVWGKLAAVNASNGNTVWENSLGGPEMAQPFVVNGTAFIGTGADFVDTNNYRNNIMAINATTGRILWSIPTIAEHMPTFVYYNHTIVVPPGLGPGTDGEFLYAFNASTGRPVWRVYIGGESAMSSITLVGDIAYFGVRLYRDSANYTPQQNAFFAVNLKTRKILWENKFNASRGTQDATPAVWNNVVVTGYAPVVSAIGNITNYTLRPILVGMNASNGKILWRFPEAIGTNPPRSVIPAITAYNNVAYSDNPTNGILYAINMTTGMALWSYNTGLTVPNPAIVNNHILVTNQSGTLFVLNMDGTLANKVSQLGQTFGWCGTSEIAVVGNKLVFGGINGQISFVPVTSILGSAR